MDFEDADDNMMTAFISFPQVLGHEVVATVERGRAARSTASSRASGWCSTRGCRAGRGASRPCARRASAGDCRACAGTSTTAGCRRASTPATRSRPPAASPTLRPGPRVDGVRRCPTTSPTRSRCSPTRASVAFHAITRTPAAARRPGGRVRRRRARHHRDRHPHAAVPRRRGRRSSPAGRPRPSWPADSGRDGVRRPNRAPRWSRRSPTGPARTLRRPVGGPAGRVSRATIDVVYDTVGSPMTVEVAHAGARRAGARWCSSGVSSPARFEWTPWYFKELRLDRLERVRRRGVRGRAQARHRALPRPGRGRAASTSPAMLTHRFALDEWRDAFTHDHRPGRRPAPSRSRSTSADPQRTRRNERPRKGSYCVETPAVEITPASITRMIDVPAWSVLFGSMRFRPGADLDTGQIEDRRGAGSSLGGRGVAIGGGAGGLILILVIALLGGNPFSGGGTSTLPLGSGQAGDNTNLSSSCHSGADANQSGDCRIVGRRQLGPGVLGPGGAELPRRRDTVLLHAARSTRGAAPPPPTSARSTAHPTPRCTSTSASSMSCAAGSEPEVARSLRRTCIAHEYGHHVQNLLGTEARVGSDRQGPTSGSVRLELQADCYAGRVGRPRRGDRPHRVAHGERHQRRVSMPRLPWAMTGSNRPRPDGSTRRSWTHGSARQRQRWFTAGYRTGQESSCDTFAADAL